MQVTFSCLLAGGLALMSCAHSADVSVDPRALQTPLGWVDGQPIMGPEFDPKIQDRLTELADDCAQRQFALRWSGLEDAMATRLLTGEATRRGISLELLLHQEVESRVGPPSEDEVRGLYEANRATIQVPYAQAAPFLRKQYQQDRIQALRRALTDRLRQSSDVRYTLPPPHLQRVTLQASGPSLGPANAPVTLVLYSDFTCPYSAQARRLVKRLLKLYPKSVRLVYEDFPLDHNPLGKAAAQAAHCAKEQNKFWPFYDILFDNNAQLKAADLPKFAAQIELNTEAFAKCLASDRPGIAVMQSQTEARHLGVKATPTVFLNGMRLTGVLPLPLMQAFVDHELAPHNGAEPNGLAKN